MRVDILGDSANTRSQQRGGFKGEGYNNVRVLACYPAAKLQIVATEV
ncbi:hypothetical protein [Candidatus Regiella insecticola]|nr:hypothetical protein [Candidatus Regiella insecticola]